VCICSEEPLKVYGALLSVYPAVLRAIKLYGSFQIYNMYWHIVRLGVYSVQRFLVCVQPGLCWVCHVIKHVSCPNLVSLYPDFLILLPLQS